MMFRYIDSSYLDRLRRNFSPITNGAPIFYKILNSNNLPKHPAPVPRLAFLQRPTAPIFNKLKIGSISLPNLSANYIYRIGKLGLKLKSILCAFNKGQTRLYK